MNMSEQTQEPSLITNGVFDNSSFNAVFFSFLITSVIGCLLKIISYCYKSKCRKVKICCITIIRDIESEATIDRTATATSTEANI